MDHHPGPKEDGTGRLDGLTFATCQAANTVPVSRAVSAFLAERLKVPVDFLADEDWRVAYAGITQGDISIGWICSRPYVMLAGKAPLSLLVAPVMEGERYGDRPIYFSDVIVRREDPAQRLEDLRGRTWAYNETGSQSGYHIMRHALAGQGEALEFFDRTVASGAHVNSIAMVLSGEADCSAIDSTVLEWEQDRRPALRDLLRVVVALGPSPIPPLVISAHVSATIRDTIRDELLHLHESEAGRAILAEGRLRRFAAVNDDDYDPIRQMESVAVEVERAKGRGTTIAQQINFV